MQHGYEIQLILSEVLLVANCFTTKCTRANCVSLASLLCLVTSEVHTKGDAKWQGMVFLGKSESQGSYTMVKAWPFQEVRRAGTNWKTHLSFSLNFNCFSGDYKSGFGGRIIPTKAGPEALPLSAQPPTEAVQPSALLDEEAEAVIKKASEGIS